MGGVVGLRWVEWRLGSGVGPWGLWVESISEWGIGGGVKFRTSWNELVKD